MKKNLIIFVTMLALVACDKSAKEAESAVTSVSVNPNSIEMIIGETSQLMVTVKPDDATDKTVTWSTSNASIATVENGKVTAVKEGEVTITANAGGKSATCKVKVLTKASLILPGIFSVSSTTNVKFSKGNLQLTAANTWKFADNQWDYFGDSQSDNHRDLFGWGAANPNNTSTTPSEYTWSEWGENADLVSALGSGWRTLTLAEWTYLFITRTVNGGTGSGKSYTLGQSVNDKLGVVLYPDDYTGSVYAGSDWSTFEAAGCVFLPTAGFRNGTSVGSVDFYGNYWSSTPYDTNRAYYLYFSSSNVYPAYSSSRYYGSSVRLVQEQQ